MNLYDYVDNFGIYSFDERPFNEVDAVIFSYLSYANLDLVFIEKKSSSINEAGRIHLGVYNTNDFNIVAVAGANKFLRYIKDTKRYKDCILFNYEYIGNSDIQFGVLSIEYESNKVFVAFEGTNELFSGWKENFMLSYLFPTITHKKAISYLNRHYTFSSKSLILGGHSKGGNLALVGGIYSNLFVRSKIKKIYGLDSPGLLDSEYNSYKYDRVRDKLIHILPEYSVVGILLNHEKDIIIKANKKSVMAHDMINWVVDVDSFERSTLCPLSKKLDKEIKKWSDTHTSSEKEEWIYNCEDVLKKAGVMSILDIKKNYLKIFNIIYDSKNMSSEAKQTMTEFLSIIIKCYSDTKKEEWKDLINKHFFVRKKS